MASTAWIGTDVKVTSGSRTVEVTRNADTDDISKVKVNGNFVASNFSLPYEVERTYTTGETDFIVLKELWQGASGSGLNAVVATSPATIEEARLALVNLISIYESFADNVSPAVTADSVVQRTANGRIKASAGVAADELVTVGQLGTSATKNTGISIGELPVFGVGGRLGIGIVTALSKAHVVSAGSDATVRIESTSNSGGQTRYINTLSDFSVGITGGSNGNFLIYDNSNGRTMAEYSNAAGWDFRTGGLERLTITQAGDIGIGTANPQYILHARENDAPFGNAGLLRLEKLNSGDNHLLDIEIDNSANIVRYRSTGTTNGQHRFGTATVDILTVTENATVGIGTTNPAEKLHVFSSTNPQILVSDSGGKTAYFGTNSSGTGEVQIKSDSTLPLTYIANNSERFRVDGSGALVNGNTVYHGGNTNFNEFGGVRSGASWIAQGFARISNTLRFIFPINSKSVPSSFSFDGTTSDLSVFVPSTGVSVDLTGSTLHSVTFDSNKLAIIEVRNTPTLPEGVQLYLSVNNNRKITFNF